MLVPHALPSEYPGLHGPDDSQIQHAPPDVRGREQLVYRIGRTSAPANNEAERQDHGNNDLRPNLAPQLTKLQVSGLFPDRERAFQQASSEAPPPTAKFGSSACTELTVGSSSGRGCACGV
jgi:hypothetical protein